VAIISWTRRHGRWLLLAGSLALSAVAAYAFWNRIASAQQAVLDMNPWLVLSAGVLLLVAYALKARGWRRLFASDERPSTLALATANGGAAVLGLALPGRFDDVVRVAIVRRYPGARAGVRPVCLSLVVLGLLDAAGLAPLAAAAAILPGWSLSARAALIVVAAGGLAAATVVAFMPRILRVRRLGEFRLGAWLAPRATPFREASAAWGFVASSWLLRGLAVFLLLGASHIGFSIPLALLVLCASAASAILPVGPAGAATQASAVVALLLAAGVAEPRAIGLAVTAQLLGVCAGALVIATAVSHRAGCSLVRLRASA
jgi:uncharacterized membrane protein YbhN (UPF0104 family)